MRRAGEDLVDIVGLLLAFVDDVAVETVKNWRSVAVVGAEQIGGGGQLFPIDGDILQRVFGCFGCAGDDGCDDFADMPRAPHREGEMAVMLQRVIAAGDRHGLVFIAQIFAGHDGDDVRARHSSRRVDAQDLGVGVGAAQECHMAHAGQLDIADVFAGAGDKARVLFAFDACAYQ